MNGSPSSAPNAEPRRRLRLDVTGAVQGVGFRPFVHRLAVSEGLGGFVRNTGAGVTLEIEGANTAVQRFLHRLDAEIEPPAAIEERIERALLLREEYAFSIVASTGGEHPSARVLPDLVTCAECLAEIRDPSDRRYRYPFTTCMHCGPRYSVIEALPYDRERTSMRHFPMCPACRAEYEDPSSRRFHAETNACPACGPQLALWDAAGQVLAKADEALVAAAEALRQGRIVALKGLGGFQLLADARNESAVHRLRERKRRPAKPLALMLPTLEQVQALAGMTEAEQRLLMSAAAPIVLLRMRADAALAPSVAPGNPYVGVMLPSTPLHHLLAAELGFAVVATSGNRGEAPIVADEQQALLQLDGLADLFLVHDRPIVHPVDDSVARVMEGREMLLRRARGYAPLVLSHPASDTPTLALGGHQKNTVALASDGRIVLGPHVGDLGDRDTRTAFARSMDVLTGLYEVDPQQIACDLHPGYHSTHVAERQGRPLRRVPHHMAHVLAGMLDNGLDGPVLGVAWDGSGYGEDGTLWGGEFIAVDGAGYRRVAHLLPFRLPGGEVAMREPRRSALSVLHALGRDVLTPSAAQAAMAVFDPGARQVLASMLERGVRSPWTSSAGRLFDAVAAILGLMQVATFEGEAAMSLEFAADRADTRVALTPPAIADGDGSLCIDWRPTLDDLLAAFEKGAAVESLAAGFHDALAAAIVAVAVRVGIEQVLLTGGCFQNAYLTARTVRGLRESGFTPHWHRRIPPNDGGLAVGQAVFAALSTTEGAH